jgi:hypothetical protein
VVAVLALPDADVADEAAAVAELAAAVALEAAAVAEAAAAVALEPAAALLTIKSHFPTSALELIGVVPTDVCAALA